MIKPNKFYLIDTNGEFTLIYVLGISKKDNSGYPIRVRVLILSRLDLISHLFDESSGEILLSEEEYETGISEYETGISKSDWPRQFTEVA
jgi:hypothetical protein